MSILYHADDGRRYPHAAPLHTAHLLLDAVEVVWSGDRRSIFHKVRLRENTVMGGDGIFADGFAIANALREAHPDDFAMLTSAPIPHTATLSMRNRAEAHFSPSGAPRSSAYW